MFPPTPTTFMSPEKRRGWIRNNINMETWNNNSGADILKSLSAAGMGIRKTDFLAIRRQVLGIVKFQRQLENLPSESLVPKAYMQERPTLKMTNNMQYRYSVLGYNPDTEERTVHTRAVSSNNWLTKEAAEDFIRDLYMFPHEDSNYIVESVLISEVWVQDKNKLQ